MEAADLARHAGTPYLVVRRAAADPFTVEVSAGEEAGWVPVQSGDGLENTPVAVLDLSALVGEDTLRAVSPAGEAEFLLVWVA